MYSPRRQVRMFHIGNQLLGSEQMRSSMLFNLRENINAVEEVMNVIEFWESEGKHNPLCILDNFLIEDIYVYSE